jgi:uncharacterized protein
VLVACSPQAPAPAQNVPADERAQKGLAVIPLTVRSGAALHHFKVEVAASPDQQERGLMYRRSVDPDGGMIFPYHPPQDVAFWMKNTWIPLDIIYIRADGSIARITHAQAMDLTPLPSGEPVAAVLEIAEGRAAQLGIREGDIVRW